MKPSAYRYALGHRNEQEVSLGVAIGGGAALALGIALAIAYQAEQPDGTGVQWIP